MSPLRCGLLLPCLSLAACADDAAAPHHGHPIVASIDSRAADAAATLQAALHRTGRSALVVATGPHALELATTCRQSPGSDGSWPLIAIVDAGGAAASAPTLTVRAPSGGDVAVDMALLACHGVLPPARIPLGPQLESAADSAAAVPRPAAGDVIVHMLRQQHAELLTDAPSIDVVFRIGWLTAAVPASAPSEALAAVRAALRHRPQLELVERSVAPDAAAVAAAVRALVGEGCRAVLTDFATPRSLAEARTVADEHHLALVVLDPLLQCEHATCCIGADQEVLGRSAGEAIRQLRPDGAPIVEVHGAADEPRQQARRRGLRAALGLADRR